MANRSTLTLLLSAGLLLQACSTVNTAERANPEAQPDSVNDRRIVTDSTLENRASITNVVEGRNANNLLQVQLDLNNTSRFRQSVRYTFEWFNSNGILVDTTASNWQLLTLNGGESRAILGVAPNPAVVDFRFKIIEAD